MAGIPDGVGFRVLGLSPLIADFRIHGYAVSMTLGVGVLGVLEVHVGLSGSVGDVEV